MARICSVLRSPCSADQADGLVGQAAFGDGLGHARDALADGPQVQAAGDHGDPPVAQVQQVAHGLAHAAAMVVAHDAGIQVGIHVAIDHDHRHVDLVQDLQRLLTTLAGQREDHAVDPAGLEESDVGRIQLGLVLRVHEEHAVAGLAQDRFGARGDGRDERVGDVTDDVADRQRRPATQALGQEVGLVLQLADRVQDPLAHVGADVGMAGQDPRDR
jgi:hypothetical protein